MELQVNGYRMNVRESGRGRPVLLIHGYPLNSRLWQPQLDSLTDVGRLIAPDLRGHGDSESVPGPYSMDQLADDCAALLDALEISEPVVVNGLSMGGYIAMAFARRYPARLAGLVLTATRSGTDTAAGKAGRDQAAQQAREQGVGSIVEGMLPKLLAPQNFASRTRSGRRSTGNYDEYFHRRCDWGPDGYENPARLDTFAGPGQRPDLDLIGRR